MSEMKSIDLGGIVIRDVLEFAGPRFRPHELLPDSTPERIAVHRSWMEPDLYDAARDLLWIDRRSYIVQTRHHTILVDTCVGEDKERTRPSFHHLRSPWMGNFRTLGLAPEAVDVVFCTHMHADHVGWNTRLANGRWVPTFPNARYLFGRIELDFCRSELARRPDPDGPILEDSVLPIIDAGQAVLVDDSYEIEPGVFLELTAGHTPGHLCLHLQGTRRAVLTGDLMHHPVQVWEPQWNSCFCLDAARSRQTRQDFLQRHCETDALILPTHFGRGAAGRVMSRPGGFRFDFLEAPGT